ncbi:MAG: hypothetical protein JXB47_01060 [Anaerolineae bacterium]|nr:hypothetical protein [Anaerolineae bacterium]
MRVLVGYARPDYAALYAALAGQGHSVEAVAGSIPELQDTLEVFGCDLILLWANLANSPAVLVEAMNTLTPHAPVAVVLPPDLAHAEMQIKSMQPAPVAVWTSSDVQQLAGLISSLDLPTSSLPTSKVSQTTPSPQSRRAQGTKTLAVWSGSSGGTGKSTLAAEIAHLASSGKMLTLLVGLNEPGGIVAGLGARPRPDLLDILDGDGAVSQRRGELGLLPGPSSPERLEALYAHGDALSDLLCTLCAAYDLTVLDLPPALTGTPVIEALSVATDVLYPLRPVAAEGVVAARAFVMLPQKSSAALHVIWNGPPSDDLRRAIEETAGHFPEEIGALPVHPGVAKARDRRQLLTEAAADGIVHVSVADAVEDIAARLLGWTPEPNTTYRLPGIRVKVT